MDKGVTSDMCRAYIKWAKEVAIKEARDKIKELKSTKNESALLEADEEDTIEESKEETTKSSEDSTTDEGFEAADDSEETTDITPSETETNNADQRKDMRQNLSGSDIKSDGGNIYVNCTINNDK